ncbi:MAG: sec-independent protein translocase protein TatA [Acidobacteriota bacterium]|nr:sec-independent protein translocase protein TatA [Acidobacteriota bacterium]
MEYAMLAGMIPGGPELIIILLVILLLFGSTRLPALARGMGKSISEFKKGISEGEKTDEHALEEKRREQLSQSDSDRLHEDEPAAADKFTVNKPR